MSPANGPPAPQLEVHPVPGVDGYLYELIPAGSAPTPDTAGRVETLLTQLLLAQGDTLKLSDELTVRLAEIELLYTISETLGQAIGLEAAAETIVRELSEVVGVERASILVCDEGGRVLRPVAGYGIDVKHFPPIDINDAGSVAAQAFRERRSIANDDPGIERGPDGALSRGYRGSAFLSVPIMYPAPEEPVRPIGVVNLTERVGTDLFSPSDRKLVTAIANQVGAALENARLVERDITRKRITRELDLARDLQRKLLAPRVAEGPLDVAARYEPAATVGGDFYQVLPIRGELVSVMLGDVSSHGLSAALIMTMVLSAAGIHAASTDAPDEVLRRLRRSIADDLEETEMHLSIFCGVADRSRNVLRYANAGHPHAFRIDARGKRSRLGATTPPLGLAPDETIRASQTKLVPGDLLVLFSDGITDARDDAGDKFGEARVLEIAASQRERPAAAIVDAVLSEVSRRSGADADDRTILVLKA